MVSDSVKTNLPRQLLAASLVFVVLFLSVIALFSWLIFRSLSQREVERVLLETRADAESLARQIARQADRQGKDLFTAVTVEQETQTYIDAMLRKREFVRTLEIRDRNGVLVYQGWSRASVPAAAAGGFPPIARGPAPPPPPGASPPTAGGPSLPPPLAPRSPELAPQHPSELQVTPPRIEKKTIEHSSAVAIPNIQVPI